MKAEAETLVRDVFGFRRFLHDPDFDFQKKCRGWRTICSEFMKIHPQDLKDDEDKMLEILMIATCDEVAIEFCHYNPQRLCKVHAGAHDIVYCKYDPKAVCKDNQERCKEHGH